MYVCSRHFSENDFFGGWLGSNIYFEVIIVYIFQFVAVEPNKRRLKRGVIPSLQICKPDADENGILNQNM